MQSLKVIGPFRGPSGYDHHTREFVRELVRQGIRVQLSELQWGPSLPEHQREPWFESLSEPVGADVVLHFAMPHQVHAEHGKKNVNYTMFEASRIPSSWVEHNLKHDMVIVPTESSYRAWATSNVPEEMLRICPLGVDAGLFKGDAPPLDVADADGKPVSSYGCRFLNIAELRQRKNHVGLLRAWMRATTQDDDAVLILKMGAYQHHMVEPFYRDLEREQMSLGKTLSAAAPVCFITSIFKDAEMLRLYRTATHYLSVSMGEGWDLPMMEAAATGLQLIAPRHSAYTAYLNDSIAEMIPCREVPAVFKREMGAEDSIFFEGANWWETDEDAVVEAIRRIIRDGGSSKPSARQHILETYTWEKAAARLIEILGELT